MVRTQRRDPHVDRDRVFYDITPQMSPETLSIYLSTYPSIYLFVYIHTDVAQPHAAEDSLFHPELLHQLVRPRGRYEEGGWPNRDRHWPLCLHWCGVGT